MPPIAVAKGFEHQFVSSHASVVVVTIEDSLNGPSSNYLSIDQYIFKSRLLKAFANTCEESHRRVKVPQSDYETLFEQIVLPAYLLRLTVYRLVKYNHQVVELKTVRDFHAA